MGRTFCMTSAVSLVLATCAGGVAHAQASAQTSVTSQVDTTQTATEQTKKLAEAQARLADWAQLSRYHEENAQLAAAPADKRRVVFLGDSITDAWGRRPGTGPFFPGRPYVNRGISGQTTPQMLVRFEQDVVRLHPAVVVILAGTNDIAGNTGPETPEGIEDNFRAMTAIAQRNRIAVVLASILPAASYPWRPEVASVEPIRGLNSWLSHFAAESGSIYLDYYTALVDDHGGMRARLSSDGVHPLAAGYAIMAPLAERAITAALSRRTPGR